MAGTLQRCSAPWCSALSNVSARLSGRSSASRQQTCPRLKYPPGRSKTRQGWVSPGELRPDELLAVRNGPVAVAQVKRLPGSGRVYNLEIHGQHVYRVGPAGVLVHNNGDPCLAFDTQYGRNTRTVDGYKHALSPEHIREIAEKAGEVVARRADGTPFDHLTETRRAIAGAKDRIKWLKKHLSDPNLTEAQRQIIEGELREFSLLLDFARRVLQE